MGAAKGCLQQGAWLKPISGVTSSITAQQGQLRKQRPKLMKVLMILANCDELLATFDAARVGTQVLCKARSASRMMWFIPPR